MATCYRPGGSGDRIPEGVRFYAPVKTGPGAYPASCRMGTDSFPGVKWLGRGIDHRPPSRAGVKGRVQLYFYSPSRLSWAVIGRSSTLPAKSFLSPIREVSLRVVTEDRTKKLP
jgi:hypothetical protein